MKIRDVIARDLSQRIEPIVKVYDRTRLAEELRGFVITDSLSGELRKFCDNFTESLNARIRGGKSGDGMAVWIWGFFGSGKSHVAKVLGHLLQNEVVEPGEGRTAIDLFAAHLDDPTLAGAANLKASLAEIRNNTWCKTIAFEIKSEVDAVQPRLGDGGLSPQVLREPGAGDHGLAGAAGAQAANRRSLRGFPCRLSRRDGPGMGNRPTHARLLCG